eukprot:gene12102-14303_t
MRLDKWTVNVTEPINDGDTVAVTVTVDNPLSTHWVAAYSPADTDIHATAPIKYAVISEVQPSYLDTGEAVLKFNLVCMRASYAFLLYTNYSWTQMGNWSAHRWDDDLGAAEAVAKSSVVNFRKPFAPNKIRTHISLTRTSEYSRVITYHYLAIIWSSGYDITHRHAVEWWEGGYSDKVTPQEKYPYTYIYTEAEMCDEPATTEGYRSTGNVHAARLPLPATDEASEVLTMYIPPTESAEVTLAMLADMG